MRLFASVLLSGVSLAGLSAPAFAETTPTAPEAAAPLQDDQADVVDSNEIIVEARRKSESLQEVPLTVNAVTAEDLSKLNIRRFEDIQTVVPGLSLSNNANGIGAVATVRGVQFDVNASGNNGTIEFYLNDSPISAGNLFQAMFDIGQVELLRGPQGTLRGRASPSGSMTVTTHKADLSGWGGYISATGTTTGTIQANGAVNIPVIRDMLAIRVAGVVDQNEGSRVTSVNKPLDPYSKTRGGRVSARFDPTDSITLTASYQKLIQNIRSFEQVESQSFVTGAAASPIPIRARDRLSVADSPRTIRQEFDNLNWQAQWAFAGQVLNYAGAMNKQHFLSFGPSDVANLFGPNYPAALSFVPSRIVLSNTTPFMATPGYGQFTNSHSKAWQHELRLSSEERLFGGLLDYTLGVFQGTLSSPTDLTTATPLFAAVQVPQTFATVNQTPIARRGNTKEQSAFANVTLHLGDRTEIAGGLRYIHYEAFGQLFIGRADRTLNGPADVLQPLATEGTCTGAGGTGPCEPRKFNTWIYSGSVKHRFNDDLMVYATVGSSWRPGISATGDFSLSRSAREQSFVVLDPEKSKSYEIGLKASAFDKKLRVNISAFHQDFTNFPYRSPGGVYYVRDDGAGNFSVQQFNFVAAVPAKVNGGEIEVSFAPTPNWDMSLNASYAKGKIKGGFIPCNDLFPRDGIPDSGSQVPSLADFAAVFGPAGPTSERISGCNVTQRSALSPLWSGNFQTEYRAELTPGMTGFARGLVTVYGDSQNDPTNAVDDVKAYALVNLFTGIRDPKGAWEISLYAKNVTNTYRALSRSSTPLSTTFSVLQPPLFRSAVGGSVVSTYYGVTSTQPREFGLNVRFAFGTR